MGVLVVGCLEHLGCSFAAENCGGCERLGRLSRFDKPLGHFRFDTVDNKTAADRAPGRYRLLESLKFHHRVAHRRAGIENDICEVA